MNHITKILLLHLIVTFIQGAFPIELSPDETTDAINFYSTNDTEHILILKASTNTSWSQQNSESSTLIVSIDNDWNNYNQDIILYAGLSQHDYFIHLGPIIEGYHTIQLKFDSIKSSTGASIVQIESIEIIDMESIDIDEDVIRHSPILYGRDLLAWNESTHTDIPLIMWHDINFEGTNKRITYSLIFSNEDSRVGIGLAELMFSYGRTTDIEWMYEVLLNPSGEILNEIFQGASHITTEFQGNKIDRHPILKNATLNCNFSDTGTSNYKFFLAPIFTQTEGNTREILMDENPWTYRIMAEELINEERYEPIANPESVEISDVRNYLYIQYTGNIYGENVPMDISINFIGNCNSYIHHHNFVEFNSNYYGGTNRTSIEIPENFDPTKMYKLRFSTTGNTNYTININDISRLFYLDENYIPVEMNFDFTSFNLSNNNPEHWIILNENIENVDCFNIINGASECDDCGICNGQNINLDDCGICFGNNEDMDCNGICFGNAIMDECGICDSNSDNDNDTCSGCTDSNAENFDEFAIFDDGNCIYSDHIFLVPNEYITIQNAIYYANAGDTVEVGPGTYNENIDFLGKNIILRSQYNDELPINNFIISGNDSTSTVTINNIEDDGAALIGFTIQDGYGKGVSFEDFISMAADENAFDSLITQVIRGGGISIGNANPYLKDLDIKNNTARNVGGGIGLVNSNAIIESCKISNNHILDGDALGGGGIAINGGNPTITDVIISNNTVGDNMYSLNGGGGILCGFSFGNNALQLDLNNAHISGNIANIGAGIGALSGIINIDHLELVENLGDFGSAISLGEPLGLAISDIIMNITNSTITYNAGMLGIGMINSSYLNSINTIFWNNGDIEFSPLPNNNELNINLNYSATEDIWNGTENINVNPLFTNPENSDYSLSLLSPCIDAGTPDIDMDGINDITSYAGLAPDIGNFEYTQACGNILGDINEDGNVNILDIINIANCILSNTCDSCSNINNDTETNILDIIALVNIILDY